MHLCGESLAGQTRAGRVDTNFSKALAYGLCSGMTVPLPRTDQPSEAASTGI